MESKEFRKAFLAGAFTLGTGIVLERAVRCCTVQNFIRTFTIIRGAVLDIKEGFVAPAERQGTPEPQLEDAPDMPPPLVPTGQSLAYSVPPPAKTGGYNDLPESGPEGRAYTFEQVMGLSEFQKRQKELGSALSNRSWNKDL